MFYSAFISGLHFSGHGDGSVDSANPVAITISFIGLLDIKKETWLKGPETTMKLTFSLDCCG